jgi:hypothetical protein
VISTTSGYVPCAISALESDLHTRLINRTTRRVVLRQTGERTVGRLGKNVGKVPPARGFPQSGPARVPE